MVATNDTFINNRWKRIVIVVSSFFLMYLIAYVLDPYSDYLPKFFQQPLKDILLNIFTTLVFCVGISELSIVISNSLNKRIPWVENPGKRFLAEASLILLVVFILHFLITTFYIYVVDGADGANEWATMSIEEARGLMQWMVTSVIIAFVIVAVNTVNYLIVNWRNETLRAAQLKQIATEAELQSLKLQLDPHFVFNNLSVLSELILENQQLGYEYSENFAKIYRYLLVNSKKNIITLAEEMKFLKAYVFLLEQRLGQGVSFDINIDSNCYNLQLPPLTLQLLVENALKHNKTTKSDPLKIIIKNNELKELIVENTINPLESTAPGSGIGLNNINRRYTLLDAPLPEIYQDDSVFRVTVPLLN
ncbi:sensor histidine kinase [Chitinophaga sp. Cy-1792]|uniref:sensor histidine kinase n=1 Tax=Chitinophaga sp. Cy-1792 TaxID=2608339 RepID=UPI0014236B51|nr:histidine kinase [Chitinophaga sp. Cy-1792]NIG55071.1 histidine kinase [Chitinophaga sp. Cy-1792]